ncbi:winged helix-turn-helix transcriptional regulator [candidate division KSB1 bacterium]|nr:winged helix-turn-helix transcriptional regulator [candidate division KSB1 bacterium]
MNKIEELSELFKALSDPTRLKIIDLLNKSTTMLCVNAITNKLGVTQSAVSQHLRILRQAGVVISERRGYFIHYAINKKTFDKISALVDVVRENN